MTGVGRRRQPDPPRSGTRPEVPAEYARKHVELAYATTVHGAQGETVTRAHVALADTTGAAAAYVAMTRGRAGNTAHLVAETLEDAKQQWIDVFAATGPTSAPPAPATPPSRTSNGTDPRCGLKRPHRPGNDGTESGNNSTARHVSRGSRASRSGVDNIF